MVLAAQTVFSCVTFAPPPPFPLVLRFRIQTLQMFGAKCDSRLLLYFMNYPARDVSGENRSRGVGARDVFFFLKAPKEMLGACVWALGRCY